MEDLEYHLMRQYAEFESGDYAIKRFLAMHVARQPRKYGCFTGSGTAMKAWMCCLEGLSYLPRFAK